MSEVEPEECLNPVGLLQELMQKNGLPTPEYTPGNEGCPPFSWHVRLPHTGQSCTASGNKKAEAKGSKLNKLTLLAWCVGRKKSVTKMEAIFASR